MKVRLAFVSLAALAAAEAAAAQAVPAGIAAEIGQAPAAAAFTVIEAPAQTDIVPDTDPTVTLGTTVTRNGQTWRIDGGTLSGANLFHSFALFDLAQGDIARWVHSAGDPGSIANVVNRVTGGDPSRIFGTIDSNAIPNADFWFVNPAGIVFGESAQLDVPAAAHFSTASELHFADGLSFAVATPNGSTLSVAAPEAFGFVGGEGAIAVQGAILRNAGALSLSAAEVEISGSEIAVADLVLAAVGAEGGARVAPDGRIDGATAGALTVAGSDLLLAPGAEGGVTLLGGDVLVEAVRIGGSVPEQTIAGGVRIAGGEVVLRDLLVEADTWDERTAGTVSIAAENLTIERSQLYSETFAAGRAGNVEIAVAGRLEMTESTIGSAARGEGDAGGVFVEAGEIALADSEVTVSATVGDAGQVALIAAGDLLAERSLIDVDSFGEGIGGSIVLGGDRVVLDGSVLSSSSFAGESVEAGFVAVEAGSELILRNFSSISVETFGDGDAGTVLLFAPDLRIEDSAVSSSTNFGSGRAGLIVVEGVNVSLAGAEIASTTFGPGDAGTIGIFGEDVLIDARSRVATNSEAGASGHAGRILIEAAALTVTGGGSVLSDTSGTGDAGAIDIFAGEVRIVEDGLIASSSLAICEADPCGKNGAAGQVTIVAEALRILSSDDPQFPTFRPGISTSAQGDADGGAISIAVDTFEMDGPGFLSASVIDGAGFGIAIEANEASIANGARIGAETFGTGQGGDVILLGGSFTVGRDAVVETGSGSPGSGDSFPLGDSGSIHVEVADLAVVDQGQIRTSTFSDGRAGRLRVVADSVLLDGNASLASDSFGRGDAGEIEIEAGDVRLSNGGAITSDSLFTCPDEPCGAGDAGTILVKAGNLTIENGAESVSRISSETATDGHAGRIRIEADTLRMTGAPDEFLIFGHALISTATTGGGDAGRIDIQAGAMELDFAMIESRAAAPATGAAGSIEIDTGSLFATLGSGIRTETEGPGDAGPLRIVADTMRLEKGAYVSSSSTTEATGDGGPVDIVVAGLLDLREEASISSSTSFGGNAGNVTIHADALEMRSGAIISSSAILGFFSDDLEPIGGNAGDVDITANRILLERGEVEGAEFTPVPSITSDSFGLAGAAGNITLRAASIEVLDQSLIASESFSFADAGTVTLIGGTIRLDGGAYVGTAAQLGFGGGEGEDEGPVVLTPARAGRVDISGDRIEVLNGSTVTSSTSSDGDAGQVRLAAPDIRIAGGSTVSTGTTFGSTGNAGLVSVEAERLLVDGATVASNTEGAGVGGNVFLAADTIDLTGSSEVTSRSLGGRSGGSGTVTITGGTLTVGENVLVSSETLSPGDAGLVVIDVAEADLLGRVSSTTGDQGNAGSIEIGAERLRITGTVTSNSGGSGDAGSVTVVAGSLDLDGGRLTSGTSPDSGGASGQVIVAANEMRVRNSGSVETTARTARPAGNVVIAADVLSVDGTGSRISSANENETGGDAGSVLITARELTLSNGASITTSSVQGAAGDIGIFMPADGRLFLLGADDPGVITTSSGPGTGGRIVIGSPYAIVSHGGRILALGQQGGANVQIQTQFFIRSSDRLNLVAVDGDFLLDAAIDDLSSGAVERDLSVLDASGVLRGQCPAARASGEISQLTVLPVGPYSATGPTAPEAAPGGDPISAGTCL